MALNHPVNESPVSLSASSLTTLRRQLISGETSAREIVEDVIAQVSSRDTEVGAFLSFDPEAALAEADQADLSLPLGGLPIGIKDNINVAGQP